MAKAKSRAPLTKREKFERAGRFSVKKAVIIGVVVVAVAGGVVGYVVGTRAPSVGQDVTLTAGGVASQTGNAPGEAVQAADAAVASGGDGVFEMVALSEPTVSGDSIELSLSEIKNAKIGGVLYSRTTPMPAGYDDLPGAGLPLLAYISPSGKLVVASSLCEPCHSYNFHIEGSDLVCNACFTRWNLDTLEGVSGGCTGYPPSVIDATVQGDKVIIPTDVLESWAPRA